MRTLMVMARGMLTRLRYVLQVLPMYTTLIWLVKSTSTASECNTRVFAIRIAREKQTRVFFFFLTYIRFRTGVIKLNVVNNANSSTLVLNTTVVADSWWATVKHYLPESVERPSSVAWLLLAKRVCTGKILYPV